MPVVRTDLRDIRPSAREISYSPTSPLSQRNVQKAIEQVVSIAQGGGGTAPPAITPTFIGIAQSPYAVQANDYLLMVDTSGGAVSVQLPLAAARNKLPVIVKDSTGNASTNPISVLGSGLEGSDGFATYLMQSDFDAKTFNPKTNGYAVL